MGSSVRYNRTLEPYLRSRGRENEVINDFCHAPFLDFPWKVMIQLYLRVEARYLFFSNAIPKKD